MNGECLIFKVPETLEEIQKPEESIGKLKYKLGSYNNKLAELVFQFNGLCQTIDDDFSVSWLSSNEVDAQKYLNFYQKVNHFPFSKKILGNKAQLADILQQSEHFDLFPKFFPRTFIIPRDKDLLFKAMKSNPNSQFIMKPQNGSYGNGIKLVSLSSYYSIFSETVVCDYIANPLCIDGFKFDLRIYVLVTSWAPLRAFIYKEGIARFATTTYHRLSKNKFSHLTNAALNKQNNNWCSDFKWKLSELLDELEFRYHKNKDDIMGSIINVVSRTLAIVQPSMAPEIRRDPLNPYYELYGFDILLDSQYNPYVLEINTYPSMSFDDDVDYSVKAPLIAQTLSVVGIPMVLGDSEIKRLNKVEVDGFPIVDQASILMENDRNLKSGNGFIRLFPSETNAYLETILCVPLIEINPKPKERVKKLKENLRKKQGIDLLLEYLEVIEDRLNNGRITNEEHNRLIAFLIAQGYTKSLTHKDPLMILHNLIERCQSWIGMIEPSELMSVSMKLKILDLGQSAVFKILKNCQMRYIKKINILFE